MSRALNQVRAQAVRPVPAPPQREELGSDWVWVPERFISMPGEPGGVRVPAHWERRISDRQFHVPPLVIFKLTEGTFSAIPAAIKEPPDARQGP